MEQKKTYFFLSTFVIKWHFEDKLSSLAKRVELHESQFLWKEEQLRSLVFEALPCTGFVTGCMGTHSPSVEIG